MCLPISTIHYDATEVVHIVPGGTVQGMLPLLLTASRRTICWVFPPSAVIACRHQVWTANLEPPFDMSCVTCLATMAASSSVAQLLRTGVCVGAQEA